MLYASRQKAKSVFLWSVASSCNFFSVKEEFTIKLISLVRIAGTSERTCVILQSEQKTTVKSLCQQFCFQQEKDLGMSLKYGPTALRRWMEGEGFASGRQQWGRRARGKSRTVSAAGLIRAVRGGWTQMASLAG